VSGKILQNSTGTPKVGEYLSRLRKEPVNGVPCYRVSGILSTMGTLIRVSIIHSDPVEAQEAVRVAFKEILRVNGLMSPYLEESEPSQLNRKGHYQVTGDTKYVIERAILFSKLTEGAFDITCLPLLKVWQKNQQPSWEQVERALELVDYRKLRLDDHTAKLERKGMGITLSGIAKGYAADKAVQVLRERNIRHALVNAGGDIRVMGGKSDSLPWRIGLYNPLNRRRLPLTIYLREGAIATSGLYSRGSRDILDARTGQLAREVLSSTVIARTALEADALATSVFILGTRGGLELAGQAGAEALLIGASGELVKTERFFSFSNPGYYPMKNSRRFLQE